MIFLNPAALWWLSLLIPLAALYFLKVKPERHQSALLFLWEKVFQEKQSSTLFKRFRNWLSLLLLTLAFIAIVFAMAKPYFAGLSGRRNLIIIIDCSASMNTLQGGESIFEMAQQKARNIIRNLLPSQRAVLASVGTDMKILVGATSNKRELLEGISKLKPTQCALNPEAFRFLKKRKDFYPDSRALLLTDGCFIGAASLRSIEIIKVGSKKNNAGIIGFDIVRLPSGNNSDAGIYINCASTYPDQIQVDLSLACGTPGNVIKVFPLKLKKGVNRPQILKVENAPSGKWFASLDKPQSLSIDNMTCAILRDPPPVKVGILSSNGIYSLLVGSYSQGKTMTVVSKSPEVLICEGNEPEGNNVDKIIIIKPYGKSSFWNHCGSIVDLQTVDIDIAEHPVMKFLKMDNTEIEGVRQLTAPQNSNIIAKTNSGQPLIYKTTSQGKTAYVLNFDPMQGDFFLQVDFPVLLGTAVMDLYGRGASLPPVFKTGSRLPSGTATAFTGGTMLCPDNTVVAYEPDKKLKMPGFYTLKKNGRTLQIAAALLSAPDTLVASSKVESTNKPVASGIPVSLILLVSAILLISLEEILYNRRKAG
ncbi:MAG: VWA domain-containing protein [Lentisphaerae bacterium]|nr:VWA domain-containing protein [Lentisphaerota bacterium]MCP4102234.1 VWA domain-containing protein [Lentisphaerota bacterium]